MTIIEKDGFVYGGTCVLGSMGDKVNIFLNNTELCSPQMSCERHLDCSTELNINEVIVVFQTSYFNGNLE